MLQGHGHHKKSHGKQNSAAKWQTRVHQIAAVLSKMDVYSTSAGHRAMDDPNDFRSCENLIEAYFMQVYLGPGGLLPSLPTWPLHGCTGQARA